jgi:hypothetical protein
VGRTGRQRGARRVARGAILLALVLALHGGAAAEATVHVGRCAPALDAAMRSGDAATAQGRARIATALVRAAYEALEPAFPIRRGDGGFDDPNAAWLHERLVLPGGWNEAQLDLASWRRVLARFQEPYGLDPRPVGGDDAPATLRADVEAALAAGAAAVRPLALVGVERDPDGVERVAFATVIWNWTPAPRLLAFGLSGRSLPGDDLADLLPAMGSCAWAPRAYARAPAGVAREFYLGNVETGVRILARPTEPLVDPLPIARGDEESAFRLTHPALAREPYAALGFTGPGPSVGTVLRLAFSLRTNVGLFDLGRYLTIP